MYNTRTLKSPVVTLLSPSPLASKRVQELLHALVGLEPIDFASRTDDDLNKVFQSPLPGFSCQWHSSASSCPTSGSIVHFLSIASSAKRGPSSMIGLTDSSNMTPQESIQQFRDLLATHVKDQSMWIKIRESIGKSISPMSLLKSVSTGGLPLTELPKNVDVISISNRKHGATSGLKEIVIPYFDYATFKDGTSFLSRISTASLPRPTVGVYRWADSMTHIRPLPTAAEDHRLSPPSLIFHCSSLEEIFSKTNLGLQVAKIGYSGNKVGQLMMIHPDLEGIDVRFCAEESLSSAFSEAQESLLAASLEELQSSNTLLTGGKAGNDDNRIGKADCWVEVRANLKRPSGYFHRTGGTRPSTTRTASIPNLPYE